MNERIKYIRKYFNLSQEEMGKRLGVQKSQISRMESGVNNVTEQTLKLISKEFNINEEWLRTGEGDMKKELEEDEVASYVSELLFDGDNPVYEIIKEVMHTYNELDVKSQDVLKVSARKFLNNLKKEG